MFSKYDLPAIVYLLNIFPLTTPVPFNNSSQLS